MSPRLGEWYYITPFTSIYIAMNHTIWHSNSWTHTALTDKTQHLTRSQHNYHLKIDNYLLLKIDAGIQIKWSMNLNEEGPNTKHSGHKLLLTQKVWTEKWWDVNWTDNEWIAALEWRVCGNSPKAGPSIWNIYRMKRTYYNIDWKISQTTIAMQQLPL